MIAERDFSCETPFEVEEVLEEKISHIKEAKNWGLELLKQSLDTGHRIHVQLELYIIQGRQAMLELGQKPNLAAAFRSKDELIEGIDENLNELKKKDRTRYDENEQLARIWRRRFVEELPSLK